MLAGVALRRLLPGHRVFRGLIGIDVGSAYDRSVVTFKSSLKRNVRRMSFPTSEPVTACIKGTECPNAESAGIGRGPGRHCELPRKSLSAALSECGFPIAQYRQAFADLTEMTDAEAADHFIRYGSREGRFVSMSLLPYGLFALREALKNESLLFRPVFNALFNAHVRTHQPLVNGAGADLQSTISLARTFNGVPILVFGDSHALIYAAGKEARGSRWLLPIDLRTIGASARGLGRDASSSGNGERIRQFLRTPVHKGGSSMPMVFAFGQVDLEFVLPYNAIRKHGLNRLPAEYVAEFIRRTVEYYVAFLSSAVPDARRGAAIVSSVLPPTLADRHWAQGYISALIGAGDDANLSAQIRAFRIPSIAARAAMHEAFNWQLKQAVNAAGFRFLDAFSAFAGPNERVDPRFTSISGGRDHHLDPSQATFDRADSLLWSAIVAQEPRLLRSRGVGAVAGAEFG